VRRRYLTVVPRPMPAAPRWFLIVVHKLLAAPPPSLVLSSLYSSFAKKVSRRAAQ
jgi:hypothetical protein